MPTYTNLAGFDMAYAVTQNTINHQLELLSALSVLPASWQVSGNPRHPDKPPLMKASLDIPGVNLVTGDASSRKVLLILPIATGTFSYFKMDYDNLDDNGNPTSTLKQVKMDGARVNLTINMSLAEIRDKLNSESKAIPKQVLDQLSNFKEDMFDIQHLFLNLEDADLIDSYSIDGSADPDLTTAPEVISQFKNTLQAFINRLKGTDNPFILGYTVTDKPTPASTTPLPTFNPTGTSYSVYPEADDVPRSTLNYTLMTMGKTVPGAGFGMFQQNWVTTDNVQGAFVISQDLIMNYLLPQVAPKIQVFKSKQMRVEDFKFDPDHKGHLLAAVNENADANTTLTCSVGPRANTGDLAFDFKVDMSKDCYDKAGSSIGWVEAHANWTSLFSFDLDAKNDVTITVSNTPMQTSTAVHPNTLGRFEAVLAVIADDLLTFGQSHFFEDLVSDDWQFTLNVGFSSDISGLKARIILPAGSVLMYKNVQFTPEGHLTLTTTYRN